MVGVGGHGNDGGVKDDRSCINNKYNNHKSEPHLPNSNLVSASRKHNLISESSVNYIHIHRR
jgi:hypothetical protein